MKPKKKHWEKRTVMVCLKKQKPYEIFGTKKKFLNRECCFFRGSLKPPTEQKGQCLDFLFRPFLRFSVNVEDLWWSGSGSDLTRGLRLESQVDGELLTNGWWILWRTYACNLC